LEVIRKFYVIVNTLVTKQVYNCAISYIPSLTEI
jgi:hypothetical protein